MVLFTAPPAPLAAAETFKSFKLKALDGSERTLADFKNRATLIVFFHPTCQYCLAALPKIQTIADDYKDRGLSVVWINVLPEENRLLKEWQAEHRVTAPILAATSSVQRNYRLTMTPTHVLIDSQATVLWKHAGYREGDESQIESEIVKALK
jgi:thiol-disulfide isomerase/thioredoxin